ncbi:MAG: cytochrome B [Candidatus Marinimicrobia bacterium]|nr:cytochrome B [Candidatus Neomarinimicrobiota bacterium]|tara:strand:- start:123 stop:713 length:591 start_codon:yes stop_codon:yes gene_type:complete
MFRWLKNLYDWVLHWAETPYAIPALMALAFAESSFFPIPVDVLLIAMAVSIPKRSFEYASYVSLFSVLGGAAGYIIGNQFMGTVGSQIINLYGYEELFTTLSEAFRDYNFIAVLTAAFTPIPYKVFTITAGAVSADFMEFFVASAIGRTARFFAVGALIYFFGESIKSFIERYFNILSVLFTILLIGGFFLISQLF